jgi:RNA polymerase sigma factor (sigma-70 family)
MKDIRQLHREAMSFVKKADDAFSQGDRTAYKDYSEKAFLLEKEAAFELIDKLISEPTRGVLFRSAAYLAYNIEYFDEAKELIEFGLSGKPFPEIKAELNELLEKVNLEIVKKSVQVQKNVNASNQTSGKRKYNVIDHDALIAGLNAKSPEAINDLFINHYSEFVLFAYRMIDNKNEAEDIGITAFTKLFSGATKFSSIEQVKAYLYMSTRNACLNYLKQSRKNEVASLNSQPEIEDTLNMDELHHQLIDIIEQLPKQNAVILRFTMQNMKPDEIAQKLNVSLNQVYTQLSIGIKMLRKKMQQT